jgi:hypothetical protein
MIQVDRNNIGRQTSYRSADTLHGGRHLTGIQTSEREPDTIGTVARHDKGGRHQTGMQTLYRYADIRQIAKHHIVQVARY